MKKISDYLELVQTLSKMEPNDFTELDMKHFYIHDLKLIIIFQRQDLQSELEGNKKTYEKMRMEAEEQVILLRQQIVALKKALADAQKEANDVKKVLDKEVSKIKDYFRLKES